MFKRRCAHNKTHSLVTLFLATTLSFLSAASAGSAEERFAPPVLPLPKATTQLVVNVSVNREPRGDFFVELDDEGNLFLRVEDLVGLKLRFESDRIVLIRNERYAPLSALSDIRTFFDVNKLTLDVLGKTAEEQKTNIELFPLQSRPQNVYYPRETSLFLNYGLTYAFADPYGFQSFTATSKFGARTGDLFFVSDFLNTETESGKQFLRLQSKATYERRGELQWLVLGDQFANSGDLGSAVNMGGIGFSKVYKIDPYFIAQPIFSLRGVAAYPSQAEIYMDGTLLSRQQIAPGSFDLKNVYSYTGAHKIEVVLRDPFGNEQRISYPLYFSAQLLGEGLHEYSYNVGFLREQYGVTSDEYGKPVFSAFHRYGVTSSFNIGARAEGSDGIYNGGISLALLVPRAGAFTLSLAGSGANGRNGSAGSLQHSYQIGSFSTNLFVREFSRGYATVASPGFPDMTRYEASFALGFSLPPMGGISLGYSKSETYGGNRTQVESASYSLGLSRATSLLATASATETDATIYSFFIGFNFSLDAKLRAAVSLNKTADVDTETVQIQEDIPVGEGLGYQAALNRSTAGGSTAYTFNPFIQYNARYGIYSVTSSMQNSSNGAVETYAVSAAGSLVYAGGFYGLSRPVNDSFGIVMAGGAADATVLNNGQEIGRTDASGQVIVPTLASYSQNRITLDTTNVPMDYAISGVNAIISPSLWSGSCIAFDARKVQAVTGTVITKEADKRIPMEFRELTVKVGDRELKYPTGNGGEFYLENSASQGPAGELKDNQSCRAISDRRTSGGYVIPPGMYRAWVDYEGSTCEFSLIFPVTQDIITDLGEIQCSFVRTSR